MRGRRAAAVGLLAAVALTSCFGGSNGTSLDDRARDAADRFLDRYVVDGRVVRHDQGGDTVSEGQAYAMLMAAAIGDRERFDRVWDWTAHHLRRPDGLLAWHWEDGRVVDAEPAADADLDTARALLVAADRFDEPAYRDEALALADAILAHETVDSTAGPVLVAGLWARGSPNVINPSYVAPRTYAALAEAGGDERWQGLRATGHDQVRALTDDGLPPDWAVLEDGGPRPTGPPRSDDAPGYGFDAVRVPIRFAEDCDAHVRGVAAGLWPELRDRDHEHPVELVAAAAAADAAGQADERDALLDRAEERAERDPTYYGAAWVALGRLMLTTDLLGGC